MARRLRISETARFGGHLRAPDVYRAPVRPDDLTLLRSCGRPALTPDGATAIVSVVRPDLDADDDVGGLWSAATDGATPVRRLTRGHRDTGPVVSPDGRWVAFLRAGPGGPAQLHVVETGGGEPVQLSRSPLGAGEPAWSPDSRRLAYVARVPEAGRYGTRLDPRGEKLAPEAEPPRLVTHLSYREDGLGYTRDRRPHLFVVGLDAVDTGSGLPDVGADPVVEAVQVTDGDHTDSAVAWSPDGRRLAFCSDRYTEPLGPYGEDLRSGVWTCAPDGNDLRAVVTASLTCSDVAWTPDGTHLVLLAAGLGDDGVDFVARTTGLFAVAVGPDGGRLDGPAGDPRRLTDAETVDLGPACAHLGVSATGVLAQHLVRGAVRLVEVPLPARGRPVPQALAADDLVEVAGGHREVRSHAVSPDGATVVATVASPDSPGDLLVVRRTGDLVAGGGDPLTDVAADLRAAAALRPLLEREVTASDGYPVHGWVVLPDPERFGEGPHPVLLCIHGGPYAHYGWGLFDEAQVYAGAGYAVVLANPRGSAGYGQAHGRVIRGAMGGRDAADLLDVLDGVLGDGDLPLDAGRVGVMGGSYGGYMAATLTTRTHRFAAAVVERGYLDGVSFTGSSDIGWFFTDGYHGEPGAAREQSPLTHVGAVRTPTLVIHSEQDHRTPVEQGQRWFTALRRQGVEAELLLFPGEGHELTRSGRPRHRRARFEHLLRWWAQHLPVA